MNELRRDGRALLDEARRERTPDAVARERVYEALLASAAFSGGPPPATTGKPLLAGTRKWLLLAALGAAVVGALYLAGHVRTKARPAPARAPVEASAPRPE
jgi:hypothetical protein